MDTPNSMSPKESSETVVAPAIETLPTPPKRGVRFWLAFVTLGLSLFLASLEISALSTALPTIVNDLHGADFVWTGTAYSLTSTAFLPMTGGLAEIFGRRFTAMLAIALFAIGSALCGAAQSMTWLIAARAVQGLGGGGISSITMIIVSDLVTLQERGSYNAILGVVWAVAVAIGPTVGAALSNAGQWRWLFYLNLPVSGVAFVLAFFILKFPTPPGTFREKMGRMDWIGNLIVMGSTSGIVIALSWGGVNFPWTSANVLAPLIIGLLGLVFFIYYEAKFASNPLVPISLLKSRTSVSGYIQGFMNPCATIAMVYYLPVFYQGCKDASPLRSGTNMLSLSFSMGPCIIIAGASVTKTKKYRPQLWVAWAIFMVALGLMTTLRADTKSIVAVGYTVLFGLACGSIYPVSYFPVLSPLPVSANARALSCFAFVRSMAGVWGISVGAAILQNELSKHLPEEFVAALSSASGSGVALAYAAIPQVKTLPEPLKHEVQVAFGLGVAVIWKFVLGVVAIGLASSLFMENIPLHNYVDERWALEGTTGAVAKDSLEVEELGKH